MTKNTWKDVHCHLLLGKCMSKQQWETSSHPWEYQSLQTINIEYNMKRRGHIFTVDWNENCCSHYR